MALWELTQQSTHSSSIVCSDDGNLQQNRDMDKDAWPCLVPFGKDMKIRKMTGILFVSGPIADGLFCRWACYLAPAILFHQCAQSFVQREPGGNSNLGTEY